MSDDGETISVGVGSKMVGDSRRSSGKRVQVGKHAVESLVTAAVVPNGVSGFE